MPEKHVQKLSFKFNKFGVTNQEIFYRTCVEGLVIWLEIVLKLVGNVLEFFWGGGDLLQATPAQRKVLGIIG